ncbi:hypothetical protein JX265_011565 [Neoarthrinium moseri]|uniref:Uncharacterized protein n=1 Tax=Neoarthrinium moseri TaxID=1658444 RepID=A0A9P9WC42_9PEZI|nr:uncharacterized protein JN550_011685 [Neoarthrinium moseri]KAI1848581.1 hypothetical protein JX266_005440 [Neoarthrinium moseri]KAI1856606.1 hypothetical protein JX265_011565 [Neoarthrinium moseri]KAI1860001.1 hypothetical protein JN550_011685 [Neoarthrinium moseri]
MKALHFLALLAGLEFTVAQTSTDSSQTASVDLTTSSSSSTIATSTASTGSSSSSATSVSLETATVGATTTSSESLTTSSTVLVTTSDSTSTSTLSDALITSTTNATSITTTLETSTTTASIIASLSSSSIPQTTAITSTNTVSHMPGSTTLPASIDASSYLSYAFPPGAPQPTWATGEFYTRLASALYRVDRSFMQRPNYQTIVQAINSAADHAGSKISASVEASAWGWGVVTVQPWYESGVAPPLQTEVLEYNSAWHSAASSVQAQAKAAQGGSAGAAPPRCTGMALAGVAAGLAGAVVAVA